MANPQPFWPWCPMAGASVSTALAVDSNAFGDGYIHRSTRGLNPARPSWQLNFPFANVDELKTYDDFLRAYAASGFWITPPDQAAPVFVVADTWSASISDRSGGGDMLGTFQATFVRSFNPQPQPILP
jgi:phage-related protein